MRTVDTKHLETKSDAKREADAIARLRAVMHEGGTYDITVSWLDLQTFLDVTVELVNALQLAARSHLELGGCESADDECVTCAVLAKAGRR